MGTDTFKILQTVAELLVTVSGWLVAGRREGKDRLSLVSCAAVVIALTALVPAPANAWLYNSVPAIQGRITDATTGKPIKDVVLEVRWLKQELGPVTAVMKTLYVATDEAGVYRIPAYSSVHIFSWFYCVIWDARHPLYSTDQLGIGDKQLAELTHQGRRQDTKQTESSEHASLGASSEIIFDFSLLSLAVKFKDKPRTKDFHGALDSEFLYQGPNYFRGARQLGLTVDTEAVFKQWDELAARFPDAEYIRSAVEFGKSRVAKGLSE